MTGKLFIVGTGPGAQDLMTAQAVDAFSQATDLIGYGPYVDRVPERAGQRRHRTDNREEIARARHALELAAAGNTVAVVSSGDPGVFAMASAVFEAVETGLERVARSRYRRHTRHLGDACGGCPARRTARP